jgi:hypothetical protein
VYESTSVDRVSPYGRKGTVQLRVELDLPFQTLALGGLIQGGVVETLSL